MDYNNLSNEDLRKHLGSLLSQFETRINSPFYRMFPNDGEYARTEYKKHMEFIAATATKNVVYFRAANRIGKTLLAAWMACVFMTGMYPQWWTGRRFDRPVNVWLIGVDHEQVLAAMQNIMFNAAFEEGDGGLLPKELITDVKLKQKPAGAIFSFKVLHVPTGKYSNATYKCYAQEVDKFQGAKIDIALFDEEPPMSHFSEVMLRLASGKKGGESGLALIAATPLKSMTPFIKQFENEDSNIRKFSHMVVASWEDVPHISKDEQESLIAMMPPHEIEARTKGIPYLGGGMVFPVAPHRYTVEPFNIEKFPGSYKYINGLDTGSTTFAVFLAIEPITNKIKVYAELEFKDVPIPVIAYSLSQLNQAIYMADTSINAVNQFDQRSYNQEFVDCGMCLKSPNKKLKEAFIAKLYTAMVSGKVEISKDCKKLLSALVTYIRDEEGKINKKDNPDDHPIDALLYALQGIPLAMSKMDIEYMYVEQCRNSMEWRREDDFYDNNSHSGLI